MLLSVVPECRVRSMLENARRELATSRNFGNFGHSLMAALVFGVSQGCSRMGCLSNGPCRKLLARWPTIETPNSTRIFGCNSQAKACTPPAKESSKVQVRIWAYANRTYVELEPQAIHICQARGPDRFTSMLCAWYLVIQLCSVRGKGVPC